MADGLTDDELDEAIADLGDVDAMPDDDADWWTGEAMEAFVLAFDPVAFEAEYERRDREHREWMEQRIAAIRAKYAAPPRPVDPEVAALLAEVDQYLETHR